MASGFRQGEEFREGARGFRQGEEGGEGASGFRQCEEGGGSGRVLLEAVLMDFVGVPLVHRGVFFRGMADGDEVERNEVLRQV